MGIKQVKIDVNEVTVGMFVSGLDRPWTQTPFPLQGFYVRDLTEIKELKIHCQHIYIDVVKGVAPVQSKLRKLHTPAKKIRRMERTEKSSKTFDVAPLAIRRDVYTEAAPLESEIGRAKALHQQVYDAVGLIMKQVEFDNRNVPIVETRRAASQMVDSVIRSPDAFTWLGRVRDKDEYTYSHSVRSAIWALLFGRHVGLPKEDLDVLAMATLLKDIGKTKLPKSLLENDERTPAEQKEYEKFIGYGVDILRVLPEVKPRITSVVKSHCERVNGSGFPSHLRGDKIPYLGKIAGIVTFYDETINPRGSDKPLSPSRAVAKLYELRGIEFQDELVIEFIRAIGLYPTGTLVALSNGEVAVVVEQNFERRLKPKIMVVMDAVKQTLSTPQFLDLAEIDKSNQAKIDSGKYTRGEIETLDIVQDLEPSAYDIDIEVIREAYLNRKTSGIGGIIGADGLLSRFKNKVRLFPSGSKKASKG
ncbi:MAG: diguanylate cyclase [Alteromonadaceae bacterium]|nr:MAG: diguanylate cyclase [Alteromonadaceae bacterium]